MQCFDLGEAASQQIEMAQIFETSKLSQIKEASHENPCYKHMFSALSGFLPVQMPTHPKGPELADLPTKGRWLARLGQGAQGWKEKERAARDSLHPKKPVQTWASGRPGLPVLTSNRHTRSGCYICLFEPQAPFHLHLPRGIWACPCEPTTYLPNLKLYKCQKYRIGVSTMLLF